MGLTLGPGREGLSGLSQSSRILLLLVAAVAAVPLLLAPLTPDVASALVVSRRLLEGAHLYRDIVDYAPPLIFLLGIPIELVSMATGWPEWPLVAAACVALCALALFLIRQIVRPELLAVTTLLGALVMMLASPARDVGQAEHLVVILLAPYVVWCARLVSEENPPLSRRVRLAIGSMAAASLAMVPAFLIVYAVLLAHVAWSRRSVRVLRAPEHLVVAVGLAIYVTAVIVFLPEYVRRVLPMAYIHHWIHGDPLGPMLTDWMVWSVVASSLALAVFGPWVAREREYAALARTCALASLAMFAAFLVERQTTSAHFLPARAFNFLAVWIAAVGFARSLAHRSTASPSTAGRSTSVLVLAARTGILALTLAPPLVVWSLIFEVHEVDYANAQAGLRSPFVEPLIDLVHQRAAGKPIFVLSSSTGPAFPLVNLTEATWPYRFKSLSFVSIYYKDVDNPATAVYRPPQAQSAEERAFFDDVVTELTSRPPTLLIVDMTRLKQGFGLTYFDFLAYYRQSPAFGALLRHYRLIEWKKNFQVFEYQPSI